MDNWIFVVHQSNHPVDLSVAKTFYQLLRRRRRRAEFADDDARRMIGKNRRFGRRRAGRPVWLHAGFQQRVQAKRQRMTCTRGKP